MEGRRSLSNLRSLINPGSLNSPILSLDPDTAARCFEEYISALGNLFGSIISQHYLVNFNHEVLSLKTRLGLPDSDLDYKDLPIVENDNAIRVLAYIAIYINSEYVKSNISELKTKKNIINVNLLSSQSLIRVNKLTPPLRGPKVDNEELKRKFLISLLIQYLHHDMENNVYSHYNLKFNTLIKVGDERFNDLPDIWSSNVLRKGFRAAGFKCSYKLSRAIDRMKQESYFIAELKNLGEIGATFLGNHIIFDENFNWVTKTQTDPINSKLRRAGFLSIAIHELGHLIDRIDDQRNWYNLTPIKHIYKADLVKEELAHSKCQESGKSENPPEGSGKSKNRPKGNSPPRKKLKTNSGEAAPINEPLQVSNDILEERKETRASNIEIQDNQIIVGKDDREMGLHVETQLFGFVCTHMNLELAEFLLNRSSWSLQLEEFQQEFKRLYKVGIIEQSPSIQYKRGRENDPYIRRCVFNTNRFA